MTEQVTGVDLTSQTPPVSAPDLLGTTRAALDRMAAEAQREWRAPSLSAGLVRDGRLLWSTHLGWADVEAQRAADDDTQYLVGSITKTFTALLVMRLRDAGKLTLDDRLGDHLPGVPLGEMTLRTMLAHASGLQREFATPVWETLDFPDAGELLEQMAQVERVLPPSLEFHYSNLAFALLGQVVECVGGAPFAEQLRAITGLLGMTRTGLEPDDATRAHGYYVHPYTGVAEPEPVAVLRSSGPVGGIWSTVADLARYAAFVADPVAEVLAPETVEEMCRPVILTDLEEWTRAYGLGYALNRAEGYITAGHEGAMPGFLAGVRAQRKHRVGAVVLANGSSGALPGLLAQRLVAAVLDAEPRVPEVWRPERPDPRLAELTGTWWSEGDELRFVIEDGSLCCGLPGRGWALSRSRFVADGEDCFRVAEGRERGERLVVQRDADGKVERMRLATYAVTREPLTFDQL